MNIILKQSEIVAAIKAHLISKGMDLSDKTVDVAFTAGRKETGLTADVSIEEADLPDLGEEGAEAVPVVAPALSLVTATAPVAQEPAADAEDASAPFDTDVAAPAVKTTSLFGG